MPWINFSFNSSWSAMSEESSDQINPLIRLENWLKSEIGPNVLISRGHCRRSNRTFLDVTNRPKEMTFLATFHLIFSVTSESLLQLHLVAFNGKIIDACPFELVIKTYLATNSTIFKGLEDRVIFSKRHDSSGSRGPLLDRFYDSVFRPFVHKTVIIN